MRATRKSTTICLRKRSTRSNMAQQSRVFLGTFPSPLMDSVKAYVPRICYVQNVEGFVDDAYQCNEGYRTCITEELEDGYAVKLVSLTVFFIFLNATQFGYPNEIL